MAANTIPLVVWSGFLANIWIPAAAALPWAIPDHKPHIAIGNAANNKYKPCDNVVSGDNLKNINNPITNP